EVLAQRIDHLGNETQLGANLLGVAERLELAGQLLAERTGRVARRQLADLVEFQKFERMRVHHLTGFHATQDNRAGPRVRGRHLHCKVPELENVSRLTTPGPSTEPEASGGVSPGERGGVSPLFEPLTRQKPFGDGLLRRATSADRCSSRSIRTGR